MRIIESLLYIPAAYLVVGMGGILFACKRQRSVISCVLCYIVFFLIVNVYVKLKLSL